MNKEIFIKYFKGTASELEERELIQWIEQSESNRSEFLMERKLWDMVTLNSSSEYYLESQKGKQLLISRNNKKWYYQVMKIAAIFLIALCIDILFTKTFYHEKIGWNTIEVPIGQRTCLHLADGTTVWLNAKSKFSFPEKFNVNIREVRLDGEGIFDVSHNDKMPFIVKTKTYNVKVLGTEFNVYAYSNSNIFETTLVRGKVVLENTGHAEKPVELLPNQMATYEQNNKVLKIKNVDTRESLFWKDGIYYFNDQPFGSIIQRLERYYEVSIQVKESKILNQKFTGKFRYSDPIEVILEVIKKNTSFGYIKKGSKIIITK